MALREMDEKDPRLFGELVQLLLRVTADEQDVIMSYLVSRLS